MNELLIEAREPSATGAVRRAAAALGERVGLDAEALGRLALVCAEATENLVRHGGGGEVLIRARGDAVELLALDRGPGIADLGAAFADGASGAGTAGFGLGSLRRQADAFDVHSAAGRGTAVLARVRRRGRAPAPARRWPGVAGLEVGALRVSRRGEARCGDGWSELAGPRGRRALCVVDGVGHGDDAAVAAEAALAAFEAAGDASDAADRLGAMDAASRTTRGAVGAVALCSPRADGVDVEHAGTGNVVAFTLVPGADRRRLYAADGTLGRGDAGGAANAVRTNRYALAPGALLVVHTDGLVIDDGPDAGAGLLRRDPTLIAAVLYRDHGRRDDDCAVLVARALPATGAVGAVPGPMSGPTS